MRFLRGFTLGWFDPERRIAFSAEGDEQPFELLMATPPIHAVDSDREWEGDPPRAPRGEKGQPQE
ncbi:hypothetical protein PDB2_05755 [Pseudomonas aeruginosa]